MTLTTETIPSIAERIAQDLKDQTRLAITVSGNELVIPDDISESAAKHLVARLGVMQGQTEKIDAFLRYNIGRSIMHIASCGPERRDIEEVIDELDLPKLLNRSAKTVLNWCYVARTIPPQELKPVSWTVLSEAAAAPPKDPAAALEWRQEREKLLDEAASDPETVTAKKVREKVKELKTKLNPSTGSERSVREPTQELLLRYVKLARLYDTVPQSDLLRMGLKGPGHVRDLLTDLENELINRDAIEADPAAENIFWIRKEQ